MKAKSIASVFAQSNTSPQLVLDALQEATETTSTDTDYDSCYIYNYGYIDHAAETIVLVHVLLFP